MVATRKQPSAPAPPISRTNSTQQSSRTVNIKSHSKTSDSHSGSSSSSSKTASNGAPLITHATHSSKSMSKTPLARQEKRSLVDRIFFLLLATFAAYALYVCPSDSSHDYSVCRSLATYRTHVLEPYVIPPIRAALTHPSVVQPYEQYAKPVYQNYIQPATPYLAAAQRQTAPYVNTAIRFSERMSSSFWNTVVVPYWTRAVVPRYVLYLEPRVNKYVSPLIKRVRHYNRQAEPYVRSFAHNTSIYARKAQEYALFTYHRSWPYAVRVYAYIKPHVFHGYARIRPVLFKLAQAAQAKGTYVTSKVVAFFRVALVRVGDLRREFVDPHALRIWEKAVEKSEPSLSKVEPTIIASGTISVPAQTELPASFSAITSEVAHSEPATVEAVPQPTADTGSSTVESIPPSSTDADHVTQATEESMIPGAPTLENVPTPVATLEKAASVAEASAAHASNVIAGMENEIKEAEAQLTVESNFDPVEPPAPTAVETTIDEQLRDVSQDAFQVELEDLEGFLQEIGLDDEEKAPEPEPVSVPITPPEEEEDLEAKKAATAVKRANIVARHVRWQSELDSLIKNLENRAKQDIVAIRRDAIAHIGRLPSDKTSSVADGKGKEVINRVQADGVRLLKGLDAYVKKLTGYAVPREDLEKEKEKWEKVVDKVEGKFKDVVRGVQEDVHGWYTRIKEEEVSVVLSASNEVKALADRAQADLGLDYAWLDDVTYYDWQNYHDLMRGYERFDKTIRALQNGTHTDAPEDKLVPVLDKLDREVQNIIASVAMKMTSLVREGDRWLDSALQVPPANGTEEDEDEECEEDEDEVEEPVVSILPVSPEPSTDQVDPANVVIGKSAEQVEKMAQQAVADQRVEL